MMKIKYFGQFKLYSKMYYINNFFGNSNYILKRMIWKNCVRQCQWNLLGLFFNIRKIACFETGFFFCIRTFKIISNEFKWDCYENYT